MKPFAEPHVNISIVDPCEFNIFLIRSISVISLGGGSGRWCRGDPDLTIRRIAIKNKNKKLVYIF